MKKYFLLATTALLLGTSNVMAEVAASAVMRSIAAIKPIATIQVTQDMNWGTFYFDWNRFPGAELKIGSFTINGFTAEVNELMTHHDGNQQPGLITSSRTDDMSITLDAEGETQDSTPAINGMQVRNLRYVQLETLYGGAGASGETGKVIGDLYVVDMPDFRDSLNQFEAYITVNLNY